ncbi:hypothetical protein HU200_013998 [Digitaria exilis]|uniref:F-box domain-containing protein n=1 Tax=Digitaria exilis TaxID=1010633 RepID=A0A835FC90_9POAL|nr:hypothetical protein HU200_013998 [Digitaria exilis]
MESNKRRQDTGERPPVAETSTTSTVHDVPDHVLELILLRLDSSRWCRVVVDAGFLKRFRLLHVPVMGYYHNVGPITTNATAALAPLEDPQTGRSVTIEPSQARGGRSPSSWRFRHVRGSATRLEEDVHPRAGVFRHVRGPASSSLRVKLEPATPGTAPETLRIHCATPPPTLRKGHRSNPPGVRHYANHSFDFACLGCATILEGNPRRKLRSFDSDAPELEGAIPARVVRGMGSTGLRSSSPSPTLLVTPYYEQHETGAQHHCWTIKTPVSPPAIGGNEWLAPQSLAPTHNYSDLPVFQHVPAWHDVSCPWEGTIDVHNTVGSFFFAGRANGSLYWGTVSRGSASRATAGVSQIAVPESIIGSYEAYLFRVIGSDDGTLRSMLGSMESGGEWVLQTRVRLPDVDTNYYLPMWRAVVVAVHETYVLVSPGYSRWLFSVDLRTMAVERVRERDVYYEEQAYPFEQQWPPTLRASPSSPINVPARHWPNNHPPPPCQQAPSSTSPACTCLPLGPACVFTLRKLNVEFIGRMRVQNVLPLGLLGKLDPDSTNVCADVHAT